MAKPKTIVINTGIPTDEFTPDAARAQFLTAVKDFNTKRGYVDPVGLGSVFADPDWDDFQAKCRVPTKEVLIDFLMFLDEGAQSVSEDEAAEAADEMWE